MRRRLRDSFDVTLPRFDLMAQLDKAPNGMTLGELSQRMMVSNGNVTGLAERLVEQGLLDRRAAPNDRRAQIVSLTAEGRRAFRAMARTHEDWIAELFAGLSRRRDRSADDLAGEDQDLRPQGRDRPGGLMIANPVTLPLADYQAQHVRLAVDRKVATLTLNRPDKKNPLTFESYAEIGNIFRAAAKDKSVKAFVITGEGGNFCSGGDVFEIIGPLVEMDTVGLLEFTRMTGEAVKAMRQCPQPIVAAIDGVCAGAGAILAMASDLRLGTAKAKVAFLFNRVGLAGCDMGACAILPRIIGQGRAAELLYTGRVMGGEEAERWGFFNRLAAPENVLAEAEQARARARRRPDLRQCHDQAHARDGMGDVGRAGDRGRGGRAGAVHGDGRFRARLPGVRREAEAGVRGQLMLAETLNETLTWPFFEAHHRGFADGARALGRRDPARPAA